jgi:hypothetical protein
MNVDILCLLRQGINQKIRSIRERWRRREEEGGRERDTHTHTQRERERERERERRICHALNWHEISN